MLAFNSSSLSLPLDRRHTPKSTSNSRVATHVGSARADCTVNPVHGAFRSSIVELEFINTLIADKLGIYYVTLNK